MMSNMHETPKEYHTHHDSNIQQRLDYGTKLTPEPKGRFLVIMLLRLFLLILSVISAIQMIVTFLPTRDMYTTEFLISLAAINVLFYLVSKRRWTRKTRTNFDCYTKMAFFSALFLLAATATLPKSTLASFLFLICCWLATICINVVFFNLWTLREARSYLHD